MTADLYDEESGFGPGWRGASLCSNVEEMGGIAGFSVITEFEYAAAVNDCNYNDIPDSCDITDGTSNDVNLNGVPDECETDCNENGIPDDWEIKNALVLDCNENMLPDECDIADGTSTDVNSNGIPDECEPDCNGNGVPDSWDVKTGAAIDCNNNGIPDSCDVASGCDTDCNVNGIPDSCDIANGTSEDINANNLPDECECIADISGDGVVNIQDILALIGYWDSSGPLGDLNADGIVSIHDLLILVAGWGECTDVPCGPPMAGAVQWPVEVGGNGHWYAAVQNTNSSWDELKIQAEQLGGYLVTITSTNESNWLWSTLASNPEYWAGSIGPTIGLFQDSNSGDYNEPFGAWSWVTGESFAYDGWGNGEPNNGLVSTPGFEDYAYYGGTCAVCNSWFDGGNGGSSYSIVEWSN